MSQPKTDKQLKDLLKQAFHMAEDFVTKALTVAKLTHQLKVEAVELLKAADGDVRKAVNWRFGPQCKRSPIDQYRVWVSKEVWVSACVAESE